MYLGMLSKRRSGDEGLIAVPTSKIFFVVVKLDVENQGASLREGPTTDRTQKRFFASVSPVVGYEVLLVAEGLWAEITFEGFLSCVNLQVVHDGLLRGELGAAEIAQALRRGVIKALLFAGGGPGTVCALELEALLVLSRVEGPEVGCQVLLVVKDLVAEVAGARALALVQRPVLQVLGPLHVSTTTLAPVVVVVGVNPLVRDEVALLVRRVLAQVASVVVTSASMTLLVTSHAFYMTEDSVAQVALVRRLDLVHFKLVLAEP